MTNQEAIKIVEDMIESMDSIDVFMLMNKMRLIN